MVDDVRPPSSLQAREASASLHDFSLGLVSPSPPLQDASHEKLRTAPRIHSSSGPSKGTTAAAASLAKTGGSMEGGISAWGSEPARISLPHPSRTVPAATQKVQTQALYQQHPRNKSTKDANHAPTNRRRPRARQVDIAFRGEPSPSSLYSHPHPPSPSVTSQPAHGQGFLQLVAASPHAAAVPRGAGAPTTSADTSQLPPGFVSGDSARRPPPASHSSSTGARRPMPMRVRDAAMASELDNVHHLSAESDGLYMTNQRFGRPASRPSPPRARVPLPSMHYEHHGIMADGSYRIPLDHNPNEFVNMEFEHMRKQWCNPALDVTPQQQRAMELSQAIGPAAARPHRPAQERSGLSRPRTTSGSEVANLHQEPRLIYPAWKERSEASVYAQRVTPRDTQGSRSNLPDLPPSTPLDWPPATANAQYRMPYPPAEVQHGGMMYAPYESMYYPPQSQPYPTHPNPVLSNQYTDNHGGVCSSLDTAMPPMNMYSAASSSEYYNQASASGVGSAYSMDPYYNSAHSTPLLMPAVPPGAGAGSNKWEAEPGTWMAHAGYAHAGPSMHYLQSRYAVERPSRAHPLRSTPHARGRNREVFLPDVTLDSCFMQRRMWRDHHRMQRHVLERERDVEALHSQERLDNVTRPYDKAWRRREVLLVIRAQGAKAVREKKLQGVRVNIVDAVKAQMKIMEAKAQEKEKYIVLRWKWLCQYLWKKDQARVEAMKQNVKKAARLKKSGAYINVLGAVSFKAKTDAFGVHSKISDHDLMILKEAMANDVAFGSMDAVVFGATAPKQEPENPNRNMSQDNSHHGGGGSTDRDVVIRGPSGPTKKEAALEAKWDRKHLGKRLQEEDAHEADWDEAAAVAKNLKGLTVEQILENIMGMGYKMAALSLAIMIRNDEDMAGQVAQAFRLMNKDAAVLILSRMPKWSLEQVLQNSLADNLERVLTSVPQEVVDGSSTVFRQYALNYANPAESARLLTGIDLQEGIEYMLEMEKERLYDVVEDMNGAKCAYLFDALTVEFVCNCLRGVNDMSEILTNMQVCNRAKVIDQLDEDMVVRVVGSLQEEAAAELIDHMRFHSQHGYTIDKASKLLIGMPVKFSGAVMAHMDLEHSAQVFEFVAVRQAAAVARSMSRSALGPILLTMCEDKRQALIDELYRGSDGAKLLAEVFAETLPEQASILMAGLPATVIAQILPAMPLSPDGCAAILQCMDPKLGSQVMQELDLESAQSFLPLLSREQGAALLNNIIKTDPQKAAAMVARMESHQAADFLAKMKPSAAVELLANTDHDQKIDILNNLDVNSSGAVFSKMKPKEAAACLDAMDAHAAADALASMDTKAVAACVEKLETEKAVALLDVMGQSEAAKVLAGMSEKSARAVISKSSSSLRISLAESSKEFAVVLATMDDKHVEEVLLSIKDAELRAKCFKKMDQGRAGVLIQQLVDTAEVDTAEAAHIIQFIGGEKAASLLTSCDARQAAEYVAAMDFSDQSVQTVLKYLDSETGSKIMDEMSSDRRSAMAKCLAPEKCADFMSRMVPSCAAETMMHMGLAAAKEVYRRMTVEDRKRLSEQWDEEFRMQMDEDIHKELAGLVMKAVYIPPGNWGRAIVKARRVAQLQKRMAKLMANMKGVLKEYKSYKNPNRVVIAVGTAFGLVTEMASEIQALLSDGMVPKSTSDLAQIWKVVKSCVSVGNEGGSHAYMKDLQLALVNGSASQEVLQYVDSARHIITKQFTEAEFDRALLPARQIFLWIKCFTELHHVISTPARFLHPGMASL